MKIVGKPSVNPVLFWSGKLIGYTVWLMLPASALGLITVSHPSRLIGIASYVIAFAGVALALAGLFSLGRSTRFGIPREKTEFKSGGVYRLSRNPIYAGFALIAAGSVLYHHDFIPAYFAALYSVMTYHLIILGEEKFLKTRFGEKYEEYLKTTRRYL